MNLRPSDHEPREREHIEQSAISVRSGNPADVAAMNLALISLEVALDIRDLLAEMCANSEVLAVRAETLLPDWYHAEPPIVEVLETADSQVVNGSLKEGWTLLSSAVDASGVSYYTLGRRAK